MRFFRLRLLCIMIVGSTLTTIAQQYETDALRWSAMNGLTYELKAGVDIGGTSPLPLPEEIRKITYYSPGLAVNLEGTVTKWFTPQSRWGVSLGLKFEAKGMTTNANVKNYGMQISSDNGGKLEGIWTGGVRTKTKLALLTVPLLVNYKVSSLWKLSAGPYISYLMEGDFNGHVYEGHLRTPDATGSRIDFEGENTAAYDFSDKLRRMQWGIQIGAGRKIFRHLSVHADMTWGMNGIFHSSFKTISFPLYPIYLNLGFGYEF